MKRLTEKEAILRLSALCSQAEHCAYEMEEKMRRWELDEETAARVVEHLTEHKFIDDRRFARAFAIDKVRFSKWGRRKVEQALWARHIDEDIRREVLDEIGDEEYLRVLRPLLAGKRKSTRAANDYELNNKLIRFALGRGFTIDLVRQCIGDEGDYGAEE